MTINLITCQGFDCCLHLLSADFASISLGFPGQNFFWDLTSTRKADGARSIQRANAPLRISSALRRAVDLWGGCVWWCEDCVSNNFFTSEQCLDRNQVRTLPSCCEGNGRRELDSWRGLSRARAMEEERHGEGGVRTCSVGGFCTFLDCASCVCQQPEFGPETLVVQFAAKRKSHYGGEHTRAKDDRIAKSSFAKSEIQKE